MDNEILVDSRNGFQKDECDQLLVFLWNHEKFIGSKTTEISVEKEVNNIKKFWKTFHFNLQEANKDRHWQSSEEEFKKLHLNNVCCTYISKARSLSLLKHLRNAIAHNHIYCDHFQHVCFYDQYRKKVNAVGKFDKKTFMEIVRFINSNFKDMEIIKRHLFVDTSSSCNEQVMECLAELEERGFIEEGMLVFLSNKENEVQQIFDKHNLIFCYENKTITFLSHSTDDVRDDRKLCL